MFRLVLISVSIVQQYVSSTFSVLKLHFKLLANVMLRLM